MKRAGEMAPAIPPEEPPAIGQFRLLDRRGPVGQCRPLDLREPERGRFCPHLQEQPMEIRLGHHHPPPSRKVGKGLPQGSVLTGNQVVESLTLGLPKPWQFDRAEPPGQFIGHQEPTHPLIHQSSHGHQQVTVHAIADGGPGGSIEVVVGSCAEHHQGSLRGERNGGPIPQGMLHLGEQVGGSLRRKARPGAGAAEGVVGAALQRRHQHRQVQARHQALHPKGAIAAAVGPVGRAEEGPIPQQGPGVSRIAEAVAEHQQG